MTTTAPALAGGDGGKRNRTTGEDASIPEPALEPLDKPDHGDYYYMLWYRNTLKRWQAVGGVFDTWGEADRYALRDATRGGKEYVILPKGEEPHPGFSRK